MSRELGSHNAAPCTKDDNTRMNAAMLSEWTGFDAGALRRARRMSVREFAEHLGVSDRMVSKWESAGVRLRPRPLNQRVLDESLRRVDRVAYARFHVLRARA